MRRRDIIRAIKAEAARQGTTWELTREGSNHTVFQLGSTKIPIPRHVEIGPGTTEAIFKQTEPELGRRWWR